MFKFVKCYNEPQPDSIEIDVGDGETAHIIETKEPVYVNGYDFGDRLLEDVYFEIKIVNNKAKCVGVREEDKDYMSDLNEKKWIKAATDYANDTDLFQDLDKSEPGYDILIFDDVAKKFVYSIDEYTGKKPARPAPVAIPIQAMSFDSILKDLLKK